MSAVKDEKVENAGEASSKLATEAGTPKPLKPVRKIEKKTPIVKKKVSQLQGEKVDTEAGTPKPSKPVTKIVKKTPTVKKVVPQLHEGKVDTGAGTSKPLKRVIKIVKKVVRKKKPNETDKGEVSDGKKDAEILQGGIKDVKQSTEDTTKDEKKLQGESKGVKQSIEDATQAEKKLQGENKDVKQSTEDTSKDDTSKERSTNDLKQPDPQTEKKEDTVSKEKQQSDKKKEGTLSRKQRRNRQSRAFKELKESKQREKEEKELDAQKGNKEKNVSKEEHQKDQKIEKNSTHTQKQNLQKRKGQNDQKHEEKEPNSQKRRREENESKEKQNDQGNRELGGLIFMCNGKTKPDCYRYGVMGVPHSKKDVVLGIKPGLTLFLYDFDLRLMYGIYKASSAGGFKLEPPAFGGGFPVQVRFKVHKDCLPLPESVFKNAIKDNYMGDKFKTELTVVQVKKLTELFRPVEHHQSNAQPLLHAPLLTAFHPSMPVEHHQSKAQPLLHAPLLTPLAPSVPVLRTGDRKEPQLPVHGEKLPGSSYSFDESRRYYMPPEHQRESFLKHPASTQGNTAAKQKEPAYGDPLFLSEKEYRTYGLRQQGRRSSPPPTTAPISGSSNHSLQTPYYPYHSGSVSDRYQAIDPYALYPRRETHATDPSYAGRGVNSYSQPIRSDEGQGLYSTYASHALSDYNQKNYLGLRAEQDSSAVSSRYAFAGPTFNRS